MPVFKATWYGPNKSIYPLVLTYKADWSDEREYIQSHIASLHPELEGRKLKKIFASLDIESIYCEGKRHPYNISSDRNVPRPPMADLLSADGSALCNECEKIRGMTQEDRMCRLERLVEGIITRLDNIRI